MGWRPRIPWLAGLLMLALGSSAWGAGPTPKSGGVLNAMHREDPPCWTTDYYAMWPSVKNLVPHHSIFSYARFQDVWLDR